MTDQLFTAHDLNDFSGRGISRAQVESQIERFREGVPFLELDRACTIGDGITRVEEAAQAPLLALFEEAQAAGRALKMVPASGAASRMFKHLFAALKTLPERGTERQFDQFVEGLKDFAFVPEMARRFAQHGKSLENLVATHDYHPILAMLLQEMDYGGLPKGLLAFHREGDAVRTPAEEHLVEAEAYVRDAAGTARLHFTVSPEHRTSFLEQVNALRKTHPETTFEVSYSEQKPSTDTIAVDLRNHPFRDAHGRILFRPAGHGALLENLNDLAGDMVFIKNIDNVVPDRLKATTITYKKLIGGLLIQIQNRIFEYLRWLDANPLTPAKRDEIAEFIETSLGFQPHRDPRQLEPDAAKHDLTGILNRPLRVCGMVKNEGEPGGGPFWTRSAKGTSLQIVESAQIDHGNLDQKAIVQTATHFNPVDLVCAVRDYRGHPIDLLRHVDPDACFVSSKSKDGQSLKALELPGLWNGAMADWNTVFVEVPLITFNPVKTINDLLRPEHLPA